MRFWKWLKKQCTCEACGSWDITIQGHCRACMVGAFVRAAKAGGDDARRTKLPYRRMSIRETIIFEFSAKSAREFEVTFGLDQQGAIREIFCAGGHTQSDLQDILNDACIATSIALQHGARIADLAKSFGETREEGADSGPSSSPIGAIARAGAVLEAELRDGSA
jgi:hypothetical protein